MKKEKPPAGVVVLYNRSQDRPLKGEPKDVLAERSFMSCVDGVVEALSDSYEVICLPTHTDVELALAPFPPSRWKIFNLCEDVEGRTFEAARITWVLESMGYSFTGARGDDIARMVNKARAKEILTKHDLPTPAWRLFRDSREATVKTLKRLNFPLIVKPVAEDGSFGIGPGAIVHDAKSLRRRIKYINQCYRQAALAEEFIAGREFNVSMWGDPPEILPIVEIDFSAFPDPDDHIVSFAAKWEYESYEYRHLIKHCPARAKAKVIREIKDLAKTIWEVYDCESNYIRIDMRMDMEGNLYIIEVNWNPDLSQDASFTLAAQTAGYSYQEMILYIVQTAYSGTSLQPI